VPLTERLDVSGSWLLSLLVVLSLLVWAAPEQVVTAVPGLQAVSGVVSSVGPLTLALTVAIIIVAWWAVTSRFGERSDDMASETAMTVEEKAEDFAREWFSVGRAIALGAVSIGFFALSEAGTFLGEIGNLGAEAPVVVSNVVTVALGWTALGGTVPVIGPLLAPLAGMTPQQWALLSLAVLSIGVTVKNA